MYKRKVEGWFKHYDFILLDMLCLQLAFGLAYMLRTRGMSPYVSELYRNMALFIEMIDIIVILSLGTLKGVLRRGHYRELVVTVHQTVVMGGLILTYLYFFQKSEDYSRIIFGLTLLFYLILNYVGREVRKFQLKNKTVNREESSLLIITNEKIAEETVHSLLENNYAGYRIAGVVVQDRDMRGQTIAGIPVVANTETVAQYICKEWIDEVILIPSKRLQYSQKLMEQLEETGVTLHIRLLEISNKPGKKQFVEKLGNYTVLTTSMNYANESALFMKRLIDIAGGLVGCILTGMVFLLVAPAIYISSPGPIFFSQVRVGKNGKKFKMYKFRSMYMDAEKRKAELMKDNKLGDGKMFKLDFDPRVIGNRILPDGTKKTGIGDFIRRTSLDEFPQFFNVLKGDMSIVGTRPPLVGEVNLYELHHRARLAIKPGITGMWQVSGRSDITDFEEVVKLDREYINNWSIGLDFKILFKTVLVVFRKDGSV